MRMTALRTILLLLLILATVAACTAPRPTATSTPVLAAPTTDVDAAVQAAVEATLAAQPTEEPLSPAPTETPVPTPTAVSASATPVPPTDTPAPVTTTLATSEKRYDVVLTSVGPEKSRVIRVVRELTGLGLREATELVDAAPSVMLQGVSKELARDAKGKLEAAGATVGIHAPGYIPPEPEPEEPYDVVLRSAGPKRIQVIRVVRELTGLGLREAKELVDEAPSAVLQGVSKELARDAKGKLEAAGATVNIHAPGYILPEPEPEEPYDVVLRSTGPKRIQVIRVVRELTGLGLREAKELVDEAPSAVLQGVPEAVALDAKDKLETAGAIVLLKPARRYDVVLVSFGPKKIQVIRVVRQLTELGLREAKQLVDETPSVVLQGVSEEVALDAEAKFKEAGADVLLEPAR